uniref:Uncharacterized protein n=1 Tax=Aegilops tauschii subsp. strangulata TaxID=200361 RepID=A0A453HTH4_AEGTS
GDRSITQIYITWLVMQGRSVAIADIYFTMAGVTSDSSQETMSKRWNLAGMTALVTGGTKGIGYVQLCFISWLCTLD